MENFPGSAELFTSRNEVYIYSQRRYICQDARVFDLVMRRSYRQRDVETFIWSCLKLTEEEIKNKVSPKSRTFNGRDIVGFVNTLVNLERVRGGAKPGDEDEGWGDWGTPPALSVVKDDDTEESEDEE
jgi:hypothetical protein